MAQVANIVSRYEEGDLVFRTRTGTEVLRLDETGVVSPTVGDKVLLIDTVNDLPPGTPAGVVVVVKD